MELEAILSACLGLGLAAACGFRVFVPPLVLSLAAHGGYVTLGSGFEWFGSLPALIALAVATALEIGAYYIPWLDNLLDSVATPAAVVAGAVVSASVVTGMDPMLRWTLAVIAGGGLAGGLQVLTVGARGASTVATAGFANPLVSTLEAGGSLGLSLLSIALPAVALLTAIALLWVAWRRALRRRAAAGTGIAAG